MQQYKTMHLFAGAGGGLLADLIIGHKPVVAVEWDDYCCRVLRERADNGWFPDLQVHHCDVRLFDPSPYKGSVDCIHAGFPCTDLSSAGKQAGIGEGTRSGLYREVLRIAGEMGLPDLFLENVTDITTNGLGTVLADLAAMGYDCKWLCVKASELGANHERDRWFLYANVANTNSAQLQGGRLPIGTPTEHPHSRGCAWWKDKPPIHGVDDGVADRSHRLKAIGNGQVPLQAALAFTLLAGQKVIP
jgi:DNA (cytosine-5)-methyltransferase 1